MKNSSIKPKNLWLSLAVKVLVVVFWMGLWYLAYKRTGSQLILPSPGQTFFRLFELAQTKDFWTKCIFSFLRIMEGFSLGLALGIVFGILSSASDTLNQFLAPAMGLIKSTPVASFIILAMIWMSKDGVPVFIGFLMVLPVIWSNVNEGIKQTDKELLEMAMVFKLPPAKKFSHIYAPSVMPYLLAGAGTSLGFAWKAGIAAEILSLPAKSIGKELYFSKIHLETIDLFAWSAAVIVMSMIFEKLLTHFAKKINPTH